MIKARASKQMRSPLAVQGGGRCSATGAARQGVASLQHTRCNHCAGADLPPASREREYATAAAAVAAATASARAGTAVIAA